MITESSILEFQRVPRRSLRWETYTNKVGAKMWQVSCQFDVKINLDPKLTAEERSRIEYRQFIAGGVWIARGSYQWTNEANGNKHFPIPPYAGQDLVHGIPMGSVPGVGLSTYWKEDGLISGGTVKRYGYRDTADQYGTSEMDMWTYPDPKTGHGYRLRDTPSISGEWGYGDKVKVWIELYFKGFVVEVGRNTPAGPTYPVRILKQRSWEYFWPDAELKSLKDAVVIPNRNT